MSASYESKKNRPFCCEYETVLSLLAIDIVCRILRFNQNFPCEWGEILDQLHRESNTRMNWENNENESVHFGFTTKM